MKSSKAKEKDQGLTLIGLLAIMAVMGIVGSLIFFRSGEIKGRFRDRQRKKDLQSIQKALDYYYNIWKEFPEEENFLIKACGSLPIRPCYWGEKWEREGLTIMKVLPEDPLAGEQDYLYDRLSKDRYFLMARLENRFDKEIIYSQDLCRSGKENEYLVCPK